MSPAEVAKALLARELTPTRLAKAAWHLQTADRVSACLAAVADERRPEVAAALEASLADVPQRARAMKEALDRYKKLYAKDA